MSADALWAWKSFLRGHHPILTDMGLIGGVAPSTQCPIGNPVLGVDDQTAKQSFPRVLTSS
jgi:hypothetical protein